MAPNFDVIREAFCLGTYLFTATGLPKMLKRGIRVEDVEEAICRDAPEIIEDYPEDVRGHSCLMVGETPQGRTVHVVCSPKDEYLAIITAYIPDPAEWDETGRKRRSATQ